MLDPEMQRCKHFLKQKIMRPVKFHGFEDSRKTLTKLVRRAVWDHESNSALLIGPPGSGKTTVIIALALE
jgi:replication-associated recombination protein RarA